LDRTLGEAPLFIWVALAFISLAIFAVLFDNGALLAPLLGDVSYAANYLHELFHDGRHLLGAPCH
jgi:hypothetical protein